MTELSVQASVQAREYLEEIAHEMTVLFAISLGEARGRINREFANCSLVTPLETAVLQHEEQDTWAKHIYYGRESFWWLGAAGLAPRPYP